MNNTFDLLSALHKSIRRGLQHKAMRYACRLYKQSNASAGMAFERLCVIASEDIGLADPQAVTLIHLLHNHWRRMPKTSRRDGVVTDNVQGKGRLFFVHALLTAVRAKKSRLVDHILICYFDGPDKDGDVPDWALDKHTARGKAMGRGADFFFDESAKLANEDTSLGDTFKEAARIICKRKEEKKNVDQSKGEDDGRSN